MTWLTLSDDTTDDLWQRSDSAYRFYIDVNTWNMRKLYDGRIPKSEVARATKLGGDLTRARELSNASSELLKLGCMKDAGEHWQLLTVARDQRERAKILGQREANSSNGKRGGRPRKDEPQNPTPEKSDSLSDSESERDWTGQDRSDYGSDSENGKTNTHTIASRIEVDGLSVDVRTGEVLEVAPCCGRPHSSLTTCEAAAGDFG